MMNATKLRIIQWSVAVWGIVLFLAIVCVVCFKGKQPVKKCMAYGQDVYPATIAQTIKATLKRKSDARFSTTNVKLGVQNVGMGHQGTQLLEKTKIRWWLTWGRKQTVQFSLNLLNNSAGFFRPAFRVPEGVVVENIEVTDLPAANGEPELTVVEGTILERSAIPDPEKSDYPDCRFTCHFQGNSIIKGKPCPQELSLILEGFANRKLLGTKGLKAGDRVICIAMPFSKLPQEKQTTQQADDLNLFTLECYYSIDIRKINEFSDLPGAPSSGITFTDASNQRYVSVFERHVNPPVKEEFRKAQLDAIAQELQKIEAMLAPYTPERMTELQQQFATAWEAEKAKDPPGYNRVIRKDKDGKNKEYVWRNVENSFWALPVDYRLPNIIKNGETDYRWPDFEEEPIAPYNLEALITFRDFLEANGCQLLISPIPVLWDIAARVINPGFRKVPDFQTAYMVKQLLQHNIETIYPSEALIGNFSHYPSAFFYPDNRHPSDTTQDIVTDLVAKVLSRYHLPETLKRQLFTIRLNSACQSYGIAKFPDNSDIGENKPNAAYQCRQILYAGKVFDPNIYTASGVCIIGNSYIQTPMSMPDSFPSLLGSKLNIGIKSYRYNGYGPMTTGVQQMFSSPEAMLSHVKIVILVAGTYHLCNRAVFNNIRQMDNLAKRISGKKIVNTQPLRSNIRTDDDMKYYPGIIAPNFIKILTNDSMHLVDSAIVNAVSHKPITIVIPTCLRALPKYSASYLINGQKVAIPMTDRLYRHLDVSCELPAGTSRLKIDIIGAPGTLVSVRDILIYQ